MIVVFIGCEHGLCQLAPTHLTTINTIKLDSTIRWVCRSVNRRQTLINAVFNCGMICAQQDIRIILIQEIKPSILRVRAAAACVVG